MLTYITKDISTVKKGVILHGVNTKGVMGSGIALAIRKKWPDVYDSFMETGNGNHLLGTTEFILNNNRIDLVVANGYTQVNYGRDKKRYANLNAIEKCVRAAAEYANEFNLDLYMPMIGCGLGGLSWENEVKSVVEIVSHEFFKVNIYICNL